MRSSRAFLIFGLVAGGLAIGSPRAAGLTQPGTSSPSTPEVIRVLYLHGMEARDASILVRTNIPVKKIVALYDRDLVVVSDSADKVEQCERLLRQRAVIARTAEPHEPLEFDRLAQRPIATRVFQVATKDVKDVIVLLRFIYQPREVSDLGEEKGVSVSAAQPILDASEALLRQLSLLKIAER